MTDLVPPPPMNLAGIPAEHAGPLLDVWAKVGFHLESLTAAVAEQNRRRERLALAIHQVPIATQGLAASGTIDAPQLWGPRAGFWWDCHRLTAAGFSAGTVAVYKNGVADGNQVAAFQSAGVVTNGKAQCLIGPGDRLIAVGTGITLNTGTSQWVLGGDAIQIESWAIFDYLV